MKKLNALCVAAVIAAGMSAVAAQAAEKVSKTSAAPAAADNGVVTLSPTNTKLQFVGTHANKDKPDPRLGTFAKFSGQAELDAAKKSLKSLTVEFDTSSVATEFDKLTNHLKSADFLDVREYPTAKFASSEIAPTADGESKVTGELTLHGKTKEITFPLKATISDKGVVASGEFTIKRSEFGIDKHLDGVEDDVTLTVVIGEKNEVPAPK